MMKLTDKKEEIITVIESKEVKPEEEYFIEDDLIDAINQYPETVLN